MNEEMTTRRPASDVSHYRRVALDLTRAALQADQATESEPGSVVCLRVAGHSMAPLLEPGDTVHVAYADPLSLRRGDLIVIRHGDMLLTHRLIATDAHGWRTKGDGQPHSDPPAPREAILGQVVAIERDGVAVPLTGLRWIVVGRLLGYLGWAEARCFTLARRTKTTFLGQTRKSRTAPLVRLMTAPFRMITRILVRFLPLDQDV